MIYQLPGHQQWAPLLLLVSGSELQFQRHSDHLAAAASNKRIDTLSITLSYGRCKVAKAPPFPPQQQQQRQPQQQQQQRRQQQQQQPQGPRLVAGCLGLLQLQQGAVVAIATEAKQVAVSAGSVVYRVKGCQLMAAAHVELDPTDNRLSRLLREALDAAGSSLFFSYSLDLTRTCQDQAAAAAAAVAAGSDTSKHMWQELRREFVWNSHLAQPMLDAGCDSFVLPVVSGHIAQLQRIPLLRLATPQSPAAAAADAADADAAEGDSQGDEQHSQQGSDDDGGAEQADGSLVLGSITALSRRSNRRPGSGIWCTGVDPDGNGAAAVLVETETLVSLGRDQFIAAHVQLSGSAPVVWSQLPALLPGWLLPLLQPLSRLARVVFPSFSSPERGVLGQSHDAAGKVLVLPQSSASAGAGNSPAAAAASIHLQQLQEAWHAAAAAAAGGAAGGQLVVVDLLSGSHPREQQLQQAVAQTLQAAGAVRLATLADADAGAGAGALCYCAGDLTAAGGTRIFAQLMQLMQQLQQPVLQRHGFFSCSRSAYQPTGQQQEGAPAASPDDIPQQKQQRQQQQQATTAVLSWQVGVVRAHSWASADRVSLLAWQVSSAVVQQVLQQQQLLPDGADLEDALPQLSSNLDLLMAGRADALALQLAGSEALGSELVRRRGRAGWGGAVDDAVMRLSRWWAEAFTEATRHDAQLVLHGACGGTTGAGSSSSREAAASGPKEPAPDSALATTAQDGGDAGTSSGSVWHQQPQSSLVLILALVQLLLAAGQALKLLYELGSLLAEAARDPSAALEFADSGRVTAAAVVQAVSSLCGSTHLVQLLLPLGLALLLLSYVAGWHDCYICWPQLVPARSLGRRPPWC